MIKISVIIPIYNAEKYLRECLDSVLAQTLKEIEIISVDDGSTDHSYEILLEYSRQYDNMIVLHQNNQGAGPARNKGIESSNGKYLCFMDPDDYYAHNQALEWLYMAAEENQVYMCGGNIMYLLRSGKEERWQNWFSERKIISFEDYGEIYHFQRYIFYTEIIKKNDIRFPEYRRYQDPPFLLQAMICAGRFYTVAEPVYIYRVGFEKKYTLNMAVDLLKGIQDCYQMAYENNLTKTYEVRLKNELIENLAVYLKYANQNCTKIWDLLGGINRICIKWVGEPAKIFSEKTEMDTYIVKLRMEKEHLITACHEAEEVVIYGAGEAGRYFLKNYKEECNHIVGFAVSKKSRNESQIENYVVKEIAEYSRQALVVVAVGKKYACEMIENLKRLQFKNFCYMEYALLRLLENL